MWKKEMGKVAVLVFVLSLAAWGEESVLPAEETAVKSDVDHWGLAFSDQFNALAEKFRRYSPGADGKGPDYILGVESSLRKSFSSKYWFKGQAAHEVTVCAGRNESQAFQLAVIPRTGFALKDVTIRVSDLNSADGKNALPASCVRLWRVGFVDTARPQYPTRQVGAWPDPLMELKPFSLSGLDLGLVWCEIKVPRDARAGDYRGTITVTPANARSLTLTVKLHVWNFMLPDRVAFSTMAWIKGDMKSPEYLATCGLFLEHHIDPISVGQTRDFAVLDRNLEFCLARGLMHFQTPDLAKPEDFQAYYTHIKKKGWLDKALIYGGFDEPLEKTFYDQVIPRTALIRKQFPDLKVFLATQYYPNLDRGMDVWMTDVSTRFQAWLDAGRPGRQQLWWYFCHLPIHVEMERPLVDGPNMLIDNDAVEHRLPYWMAGRYGVQGFFIWAGNMDWPANIESWPGQPLRLTNKKMDFPYGGIHNGNGFLIYPGPRPSIRLKVLRDGIQDYWYLARLTELARSGKYAAKAQSLLNGISPAVFVDPHYFNRDENVLLAYRRTVGELLDKAGSR